jgi:exodeoxyribonuclease VII small subunit
MDVNNGSFEENFTRLEQIVRQMERGSVPLSDALKLFEEGIALVRKCSQQLSQAEQRVYILQQGDSAEPVLQPFIED